MSLLVHPCDPGPQSREEAKVGKLIVKDQVVEGEVEKVVDRDWEGGGGAFSSSEFDNWQ